MFDRNEAQELCSRILAQSAGVTAAGSSSTAASSTELVLVSKHGSLLRLAESAPSEQSVLDDVCVHVRVECDGRHGRSSTSSLDEASTKRAIDAAVAAAKVSPALELPEMSSLVGDEESDGGVQPDGALRDIEPADKLAALQGGLASVREAGAVATGFWESSVQSLSYATSRGAFRHACTAKDFFSSTVLAENGGAGVAFDGVVDGRRLSEDRAAGVIARALDICMRSRDAQDVEAGEHRVLLMPQAVSELMIFLNFAGFGARAFLDGSSFLALRAGERVLAPSISIVDDVRGSGFAARGFDLEGQTTERVVLVEEGMAKGPLWDRSTAAERGVETTGHAGMQPSAGGPMPQSLAMHVADDRRVAKSELLAQLGDGLVVTQFHYTNLIDPTDVCVTGMTRNGTFRVKGGEVQGPVKNLRFTESVLDALSEIVAASADNEIVGAFFGGVVSVPALVLPRFCFTSTTEF